MNYSPSSYLLGQVDNKYLLTRAVAKRARQITEADHSNGAQSVKAVTLALEEIAFAKQNLKRTQDKLK